MLNGAKSGSVCTREGEVGGKSHAKRSKVWIKGGSFCMQSHMKMLAAKYTSRWRTMTREEGKRRKEKRKKPTHTHVAYYTVHSTTSSRYKWWYRQTNVHIAQGIPICCTTLNNHFIQFPHSRIQRRLPLLLVTIILQFHATPFTYSSSTTRSTSAEWAGIKIGWVLCMYVSDLLNGNG